MIYELGNYGFYEKDGVFIQTQAPNAVDGDLFIKCNLCQFEDTKIFKGVKNLSFVDCNLINCDIPKDSKLSNCNTANIFYEIIKDSE